MKRIEDEIDKEILDKALDMTLKLWATRSREDLDEFWVSLDCKGIFPSNLGDLLFECYYFLYHLPTDMLERIRRWEENPDEVLERINWLERINDTAIIADRQKETKDNLIKWKARKKNDIQSSPD